MIEGSRRRRSAPAPLLAALLLAVAVAGGCSSTQDGKGDGGGTAAVADTAAETTAPAADASGDDAAPADVPVSPPEAGTADDATVPRDGGCLPCPSSHQPACTKDVAPGSSCATAGGACCDPDDHFWLCRCVPRADGGSSCSWMNACGGS